MNEAQTFFFFDQLLSSSSSSDSSGNSDEELNYLKILQSNVTAVQKKQQRISAPARRSSPRRKIRKKPKKVDYEPFKLSDQYSDSEFWDNFRMKKETFYFIVNIIKEKSNYTTCSVGRAPASLELQLLVTLYYFAYPNSFRTISSMFKIPLSSSISLVRRGTELILDLEPLYIQWPTEVRDFDRVKSSFFVKGFPDTLGAVSARYLSTSLLTNSGTVSKGQRQFEAMILQCVCDPDMVFTHVHVAEAKPADCTVLESSGLYSHLTVNKDDMFPNDTHLIGDEMYPLLKTLIVPYRDDGVLSKRQISFNCRLNKIWSVIDDAFALLLFRFQSLSNLEVKTSDWACKYIRACCILHNICIERRDLVDFDELEFNIARINCLGEEGEPDEEAKRKRDHLTARVS